MPRYAVTRFHLLPLVLKTLPPSFVMQADLVANATALQSNVSAAFATAIAAYATA